MLIIGVYILTDARTGKFYIGSSYDIEKRIARHINDLNNNRHHCSNLQVLWGPNCKLIKTIFPTETREEAYILEQDVMDRYKNSSLILNIGINVKGGDNLSRNPNRIDIIRRIKLSSEQRLLSLTSLEKKMMYGNPGSLNGMWGKTHSIEARKSISMANTNNKYATGSKRTIEQCQAISKRASLRIGVLNSFYGRKHSNETKQRLSKLMKDKNQIPANSRQVEINGKVFVSLTEASRQFNVSPALMIYRINSKLDKYESYKYIT